MQQSCIEGDSSHIGGGPAWSGNMSHRPIREISVTVSLTAEHRHIPMSRIALYLFEDLLDCQLRSFQCLCEIAGIKEQSAGHILLFIVSPRCLENLAYLCILLSMFSFNQVLTAVKDFVDVTAHGSLRSSRSLEKGGMRVTKRAASSPAGTALVQ